MAESLLPDFSSFISVRSVNRLNSRFFFTVNSQFSAADGSFSARNNLWFNREKFGLHIFCFITVGVPSPCPWGCVHLQASAFVRQPFRQRLYRFAHFENDARLFAGRILKLRPGQGFETAQVLTRNFFYKRIHFVDPNIESPPKGSRFRRAVIGFGQYSGSDERSVCGDQFLPDEHGVSHATLLIDERSGAVESFFQCLPFGLGTGLLLVFVVQLRRSGLDGDILAAFGFRAAATRIHIGVVRVLAEQIGSGESA